MWKDTISHLLLLIVGVRYITAIDLTSDVHGIPERIMLNLFKSYSKADLPNPNGHTEVKIGLYVNNILAVNDFDMTVVMNFYFRQAWRDERLRYDEEIMRGWNDSVLSTLAEKDIPEHINILPEYIKTKIFYPDTFFR